MSWFCELCNVTIRNSNKNRHTRSNRHREHTHREHTCTICLDTIPNSEPTRRCGQCVHEWCLKCHMRLTRCPYCRNPFQSAVDKEFIDWILNAEYTSQFRILLDQRLDQLIRR